MISTKVIHEATDQRSVLVGVGFTEAQRIAFSDTNREKEEIERLRSQHVDYQENKEHWKFLLSAYEGGPSYISNKTLFKHQREHQEDFHDRLERACYQNYTAPIVDFVPEMIYKDPIDREPNTEIKTEFDRFKLDVDRQGTDLSTFMRHVAEEARLFGHAFVQVDTLPAPADLDPATISMLRATELGMDLPYLVLIKPLEIFDWVHDPFGNLVYVKRVEYLTLLSRAGRPIQVERYSEWTVKDVTVTAVNVDDLSRPRLMPEFSGVKENQWASVPFLKVIAKRSKANRDLGVSAVCDIAYQNRRVFNLTSLLDEFLARQCFNILAMETDTAMPTRDSVEGDLGTNNILQVPRAATHMPTYISPPVDPAQFIQSERADTIREMYRQASQDIASELFAVSNRSGDAAKQAFGRSVPSVARLADVLQDAEVRILGLWARLLKKKWSGKIAYRDDYSITSLQDLLLQLSTIFNNLRITPPSFVKEEWKRIIREFDGRISQDVKEKIYREIESMTEEDIEELYQGDTKASEGVPSAANLQQGRTQERLGSDAKIAMATGSKANTKEAIPDRNRRSSVSVDDDE